MSWAWRFRAHQHMKGSLWVIPVIGVVFGPLVAQVVLTVDQRIEFPEGFGYSTATASTVLSAIVGATIALTGFVVTVGVLIVQMATGTLSPRYLRLWYRDGLQKAVLATCACTLTFTFSLLRKVEPDFVPNLGVTIAGGAVTLAVVLFLFYLDRFVHRLRPAEVAWHTARAGAKVFLASEPPTVLAGALDPLAPSDAERPPPVVFSAAGGTLQAVDLRGLVKLAERHGCVLALRHSPGDFVSRGAGLIEVIDGPSPKSAALQGSFALGRERTIEQDPAFAFRILVDIAIRALSPAVNDPSTAVQVMDHIEDLLQLVGEADLARRGEFRDAQGVLRVLLPARTWDDYLALGVTEIREYGQGSTQIPRRLRAMLESLHVRVRPEHRPAVQAELARLDATLERRAGDTGGDALARQPDRQGLGGPGLA